MDNSVVLTACIVEAQALRYTPAGLPAIEVQLEHESQQIEANQMREVKAAIKAVAFGAMAERVGKQALGSCWRFSGFLATPRNGKHAVFHIQDIQPN